MKLYNLINPSDVVTFHAPDDTTAIATGLLIGHGLYPVREADTNKTVGTGLIGATPEQVEDTIQEWFGTTFDGWLSDPGNMRKVIAALDDFATIPAIERYTYDVAVKALSNRPNQLVEFKRKTDNKRRSSHNSISADAWELARKLRGEHR